MAVAGFETLARSVYRSLKGAAHRRRRVGLGLAPGDGPAPAPAVYFFAPDFEEPAGGIRVIYRHVDILNAAGINAAVVHFRPGFRCRWFENQTVVRAARDVHLGPHDIVVVPEVDLGLLAGLPKGTRFVVFNQNSHLTWKERLPDTDRIYASPDLIAVVTVSAHNAEVLGHAFGAAKVRRIRLALDPALFFPGGSERPRRLCYMPRRGAADVAQVLEILAARKALDGWEVVPLSGIAHDAVGDALRQSRIFLALTYQEGFGLPAAEAMACGNFVVGYHGYGGREFFRPEFSAPVPTGDILGVAKAVERAVAGEGGSASPCLQRGLAASRFVMAEYSPANEASDVVDIYAALLDRRRREKAVA